MKNYIILAGGAGVRTLEPALNLFAGGLGPDEAKILIVDPDASNGNYTRANEAFADYRDCSNAFRGKLGGERFFGTKITEAGSSNGTALQTWSPVQTGQVFRDLLGLSILTRQQQDVARLMFTETELNMELKVGFKGHPALGAAALALLPLYTNDPVWAGLAAELTRDLTAGPVRVVIVGSVFGGTGASIFFPLSRRLREVAGSRVDNLKICAIAVAPYFTFRVADDPSDDGPDVRKFPIATRAAAHFYHHLRTTGQWDFDAMYWLGDDTPVDVERSDGGEQQKNPAHFVEMLAALTCLDYLSQEPGASLGGGCYFAGPDGDVKSGENATTWDDLPLMAMKREDIRRRMLRFAIAGAAHLEFFRELIENPQSPLLHHPTALPWYYDRFVQTGKPLHAAPHNAAINAFSRFLVHRHFPWWHNLHTSSGGRVRLLNANSLRYVDGPPAAAMLDLARLANVLYPNRANIDENAMHRFFCDSCEPQPGKGEHAADDGAPAYLATLARTASAFAAREYQAV